MSCLVSLFLHNLKILISNIRISFFFFILYCQTLVIDATFNVWINITEQQLETLLNLLRTTRLWNQIFHAQQSPPPQSIGTGNSGTPCIDKVLSKERELRGDTASGNSALGWETVSRRQKSGRKSVRIFIALTHYGVTDCGVARELQVRQPMNEPRCKDAVDLQRIERAPDSPLSFPQPFFFFSFFLSLSLFLFSFVTN